MAIVNGGTRGIGRGIATELARRGALESDKRHYGMEFVPNIAVFSCSLTEVILIPILRRVDQAKLNQARLTALWCFAELDFEVTVCLSVRFLIMYLTSTSLKSRKLTACWPIAGISL